MNIIEVLIDITTILLYAYFIFLILIKIRELEIKKGVFNALTILFITFLISKILIRYI